MNRKPFQDATVRRALDALANRDGARRFLVADEVGLGKTRVAQGVLEGLLARKGQIDVFYVCSSLSIIHQNRDDLLDFLPAKQAEQAKVSVDRLTLLPSRRRAPGAPVTLYTLTPGTLPSGRRTGRADERALMWHLLCLAIDGLSRHDTLAEVFRRGVQSWSYHLGCAKADSYGGIERPFRRETALALGLPASPWAGSLIDSMKSYAARDSAGLVGLCRAALARAGLESLKPDLIIFDEFQRFFELLVPDDDDDPVARELMRLLLRGDDADGPSVLLLSATPYRLFSRWGEGAEEHYSQFYKLLNFLFGEKRARTEVPALAGDLREYRTRLERDVVGSPEIVGVRDKIVNRLTTVMSRTERPRKVAEHERLQFDRSSAALEPIDIRLFRHLLDSARSQDHPSVPAYWMSIPYPLQMMDQSYLLAQHATHQPLLGEARRACMLWKQVRRYEPVSHPHPKLRQLLDRASPTMLSLPWMPPTLPWWPLRGAFSEAQKSPHPVSKILVFSRFRAVPRSVASVLSYEAERFCFSPASQRSRGARPVAYEYRTEPGRKPAAGLKKRPARSFVFPIATKQETAMRSFCMFVPMPELAILGDPLTLVDHKGTTSLESVLQQVAKKIAVRLGGVTTAKHRVRAVWSRAARLEKESASWSQYSDAVWAALSRPNQDTATDISERDGGRGVEQAAAAFFDAASSDRPPTAREIADLAELAVLAPGNVLYRAAARVFGPTDAQSDRIERVTRTSLWALAPYLDHPDFHLLFRGRNARQHPEAIRRAVWDGNLESVLDEYLSMRRGLGVESVPLDIEKRALDALTRALSVGVATVTVQETGKEVSNETFRMRCHAALPFGLGRNEMSDEQGAFHYDDLRLAFNSPFRPHLLATTSIGQEGLDFHGWCNHVLHWDLPSNPVDLEQREGRVDRYAGLGVRQALASVSKVLSPTGSPWVTLAARQAISNDGLTPWWVCEGATIRRTILVPALSSMEADLDSLLDQLSLYRLAIGQADQESLLSALHRRLDGSEAERAAAARWLDGARIDLGTRGHGAKTKTVAAP